jgi:RimJ/RimL family protein N-acetyltransferase
VRGVRLTGAMDVLRLDTADPEALRGCAAIRQAAQAVDDPHGSPMSTRVLRYWFDRNWTGDPHETWFVPGPEPGGPVAFYRLGLPDLENLNRAALHIVVHPVHRRRRLGGALLRHAATRAAGAGRAVLDGMTRDGSPGDGFAAWARAKPGIPEAMRVLDLRKNPASSFADLRAAAGAAAGYSLVSWAGPAPEEYLGQLATAINAYADAPQDEGVETGVWDAERVRERGNAAFEAIGMRKYTVVAVRDASGELAAMTEVSVDPDTPQWGHQGLTAVTRPHRGHRLGLLVKLAMMDWLASSEPQLEWIETGNASGNEYMIAVNEALGFAVRGAGLHSCELDVAAALGRD